MINSSQVENGGSGNRIALIALFILLLPLWGSNLLGAEDQAVPNASTESEPIIDSVAIIAENVFDLSQPNYDNFLFRLANATHFVTRPKIIRRELLLGAGDKYDTSLVYESLRNLRRLPYFLKSEIEFIRGNAGENILRVNTSDKWTTSGGLSYHRSGGRSDFQIGLEEKNLLGYGIFMSHDYFILDRDRNFYQVQVGDRRAFGSNFSVDLIYSDDPRSGHLSFTFARPFYTLGQKYAFTTRFSKQRTRIDYYDDAVAGQEAQLSAQDRTSAVTILVANEFRSGGKNLKYSFVPSYGYVELIAKERVYAKDSAMIFPPPPPVPVDSQYHAVTLGFRLQQIKFARYRRLNRFFKIEDYNLGFDGLVAIGWARFDKFNNTVYDYYALRSKYVIGSRSGLFTFQYSFKQWNNNSDVIRRVTVWSFKGYQKLNHLNTLAIGARFLSDRLIDRSGIIYLDEDRGLRGYPAYEYNGEDRLVINIENRLFSDVEILTIGLGAALFADIGNIWHRDGSPSLSETKVSYGAGLRFGISRSSQAEVIRLDLAYAHQIKSWQISIGTGQYF